VANDFLTTTDLLKFRDTDWDITPEVIEQLLADAPLIAAMAATSTVGQTIKYTKKTANPTVGFRSENDGREYDHAARSQVTETLKILDASHKVDVAVAQGDPLGQAACMAREGIDHLQAAFFKTEKQVIYGTDATLGDASGFAGFAQSIDNDDDAMCFDAGGSGSAFTSVFLVREGPLDVQLCWGEEGEIAIGERTIVPASGATTGEYPAYYVPVTAWVGLLIRNTYSLARICNIPTSDEDSTTALTDKMIAAALAKMPRRPTRLIMSRLGQSLLRHSRTATNPTGAPAPFPEQAFNVPILTTDGVSDAESELTAAST